MILLLSFLVSANSLAETVDLTWDPSTGSDIAGYKVYYNSASNPCGSLLPGCDPTTHSFTGSVAAQGASPVDVANILAFELTQLPRNVHNFFAVTAYNSSGAESVYSNIVEIPNLYDISISAGAGGSVFPTGDTTADEASNQAVTFTPNTCFYLATMTIDGATTVPSVNIYTFLTVEQDHTISGTFSPIIYSITASAGAGGTISNSGTTTASCNGQWNYTITPNSGYRIQDVLVNGQSVGAVTSYAFPTGTTTTQTIAATFALNTYQITASSNTGGAIYPPGATTVSSGANQTCSINPILGYHITNVTVDGTSVGAVNLYTFSNLAANHTIAATFAINTYAITASSTAGGTISPFGQSWISYGGNQTYTITPATGYVISSVFIDGVAQTVATSYPFNNVTASHLISVTFAKFSSTGSPGQFSMSKLGVLVPSTGELYLDINGNGAYEPGIDRYIPNFGKGLLNPMPVVGIWSATSGATNIGVFSAALDPTTKVALYARWYLDIDGDGAWNADKDKYVPAFGQGLVNPIPVTGIWNTTSPTTNIGVFSAALDTKGIALSTDFYLDMDGNGIYDPGIDKHISNFGVGLLNPVPITGIWNTTSNITNIGVFSAKLAANGIALSTDFYLDMDGNGVYDPGIDKHISNFGVGLLNPIPITGDWNGSGTTKVGIYVPSTGEAYLDMDGDGIWNPAIDKYIPNFGKGLTNPKPVTGKW